MKREGRLSAFKPLPTRQLTADERMQCLLLAAMNDDRASLCAKRQEALRALFEMNANFLRSLAQ